MSKNDIARSILKELHYQDLVELSKSGKGLARVVKSAFSEREKRAWDETRMAHIWKNGRIKMSRRINLLEHISKGGEDEKVWGV